MILSPHRLQNSSRPLRSLSLDADLSTSLQYSAPLRSPLGDAGASYLVSRDQLRFPSSFPLCSQSNICTVPIWSRHHQMPSWNGSCHVSHKPLHSLAPGAMACRSFPPALEASMTGLPSTRLRLPCSLCGKPSPGPVRCSARPSVFAEKAMAPHSSTLAWKIPWTEEPGRLWFTGLQRVGHDWLHCHFSLSCIGEGNGTPLQCSFWRIPGTGEPGGLLSVGSQSQTRLSDLAAAAFAMRLPPGRPLWPQPDAGALGDSSASQQSFMAVVSGAALTFNLAASRPWHWAQRSTVSTSGIRRRPWWRQDWVGTGRLSCREALRTSVNVNCEWRCELSFWILLNAPYIVLLSILEHFPGGSVVKKIFFACQPRRHRRCRFDPWVGKILWRRAWQPTPVFWPGESHGERSLVVYRPWVARRPTVSDTT